MAILLYVELGRLQDLTEQSPAMTGITQFLRPRGEPPGIESIKGSGIIGQTVVVYKHVDKLGNMRMHPILF